MALAAADKAARVHARLQREAAGTNAGVVRALPAASLARLQPVATAAAPAASFAVSCKRSVPRGPGSGRACRVHMALPDGKDAGGSVMQVLLLPPNLVAHVRLALALAAAAAGPSVASLALFAASLLLDAVDGWVARKLGQETSFGAFYDVAIDNLTRALLFWCGAAGAFGSGSGLPPALLGLVPALEGVCLACTHASGGSAWKTGCFRSAPPWVRAVAAGGFRNPAGALAFTGIYGLPLWLHARSCLRPGSLLAAGAWAALLVPARLLAAAVECWLVGRRMRLLLQQDAAARRHPAGDEVAQG